MRITLAIVASFAAEVFAASCSSTQAYEPVAGFSGSNGCVPTGYFQAQDLGQTTQAQLMTTCENKCTSYGAQCQAYVGQLQTAPNGLSTGQCYYYTTTPTGPATCADHPTVLLAERKDYTLACFQSAASKASASAFCSSYLSIPVVRLTSTVIPTQTSTVTSVALSTSTTTLITTTSTTTGTSYAHSVVSAAPAKLKARAAGTVSPPKCLSSGVAATRISSACSCLNIPQTTIRTTVTAAPVTKIISTIVSSATATTTTTTSIVSTIAVVSCAATQTLGVNLLTNGGFESGFAPWAVIATDAGGTTTEGVTMSGENSANALTVNINNVIDFDKSSYAGNQIGQKFESCVGSTYRLSIDYNDSAQYNNCYVFLLVTSADGTNIGSYTEQNMYTNGAWQSISYTYTKKPTDGDLYFTFHSLCASYNSATVMYDNAFVSVQS